MQGFSVMIYLTYLTLAGYAWGGVTGREHYSNPTQIIIGTGKSSGCTLTWQAMSSLASPTARSETALFDPSPCRQKIVRPFATRKSGRLATFSLTQPEAVNILRSCITKKDCSEFISCGLASFNSTLVLEALSVNFCPEWTRNCSTSNVSSSLFSSRLTDRRITFASSFAWAKSVSSAARCSRVFSRRPYICLPASEMTRTTHATSLERFIPVSSRKMAIASDTVSADSNQEWISSTVLIEPHPGKGAISHFGLWALGICAVLRLVINLVYPWVEK
jgi:hypothetical protein